MRYLAMLGAATALATAPAYAAGHGYVGIDAGLLMPNDVDFSIDGYNYDLDAELDNGFDLDLIGGYDFGFIRVEGELGWKRAEIDSLSDGEDELDDLDADTDVRSIMLNVLGDFGTDKWSFYAGGGVGFAQVRHSFDGFDILGGDEDFTLKDSGFAWQGIAGVRYSVNEIIDIGLKYRYFDTSKMDDENLEWDFTSHSIMFSFIYNMGGERYVAPPPPPPVVMPPPPPPPATQTCPDGSVILATDMCPPPPPPPPPPPEPERG